LAKSTAIGEKHSHWRKAQPLAKSTATNDHLQKMNSHRLIVSSNELYPRGICNDVFRHEFRSRVDRAEYFSTKEISHDNRQIQPARESPHQNKKSIRPASWYEWYFILLLLFLFFGWIVSMNLLTSMRDLVDVKPLLETNRNKSIFFCEKAVDGSCPY
jgi:hypothetical protein